MFWYYASIFSVVLASSGLSITLYKLIFEKKDHIVGVLKVVKDSEDGETYCFLNISSETLKNLDKMDTVKLSVDYHRE